MNTYILNNDRDLEKVVNRELGLRDTNGSGMVHNDGDGKGYGPGETYNKLLMECKYTEKERKSVSIKIPDFEKTERSAYRHGRIPAMASGDSQGRIFVVLSLDDFQRIYNGFKENNNE